MFDDGDYALVITDLVMGGIDGNGVADYIRQSEKGVVPIIGISGTPWMAHARHFDAVMAKPVSMKELVSSIRLLVGCSSEGSISADVGQAMRS
jgi:DNA-binding response OmpR family regulator